MAIETNWFIGKLTDRQLSQRQLAKRLGLDPAAVSLMFRGKRRMQMSEAADIARLLGVPLDEVLAHAGIKARASTDVPLMFWIDGHGELHTAAPGQRVACPEELGDRVVAAQARTAMTPLQHMDRWMLFFDAPSAGVNPKAVGSYSVARLKGGVVQVGYITQGYKPGTYNLHGASVAMDVNLEWASPVLLIKL